MKRTFGILLAFCTLVGLCIHTRLSLHAHKHRISLLIHLGVLHQVFQKSYSLRHILAESVQADRQATVAHLDIVITSQLIELLFDLL